MLLPVSIVTGDLCICSVCFPVSAHISIVTSDMDAESVFLLPSLFLLLQMILLHMLLQVLFCMQNAE